MNQPLYIICSIYKFNIKFNFQPEFIVPADSKVRIILPLKQKWTLWFLNSNKELEWTQRLKEVYTFTQLEEFIAYVF